VRAGKGEFRAEIEAAGFVFVEEVEIPAFEENYFIKFEKKGARSRATKSTSLFLSRLVDQPGSKLGVRSALHYLTGLVRASPRFHDSPCLTSRPTAAARV